VKTALSFECIVAVMKGNSES